MAPASSPVSSGELAIRDFVWARDGWAEVLSAADTGERETVYNFEVADFHTYFVGDGGIWAHNACKPLSPNQMNKAIKRGQAPKGMKRVDTGKIKGEQTHAHFDNGAALNKDGTWKHGSADITAKQKDWLTNNGWTLPA